MYCEEEIINVWYLDVLEGYQGSWDFHDYIFGMDYYVAGKAGLVFQTEHYYITIRTDGVKTYRNKEEVITPEVQMYNYDDWYDDIEDDDDDEEEEEKEDRILTEEGLYFIGEHIRNVTEKEDGWLIEFDHLTLTVHPRTEEDQPWSSYYNFLPNLSLGHKLKRCECGGEAQLMVDQVDDYYIRCASCFRSTYADYRLGIVVKHWNDGDHPVEDEHTPMECFLMRKDKVIRDIFIRKRSTYLSPDHILTDDPILQFDDTAFDLTSLFIPGNRSIFNIIYELSGFNPEIWPDRIELKEGEDGFHFVSIDKTTDKEVLTLTTGKRNVVITALPMQLDIQILPISGGDDPLS